MTIFRPGANEYYGGSSNIDEAAIMYVNHENSVGRTEHEDSDQSSFILYYKGKQLLIDPGYRPSWFGYNIGKEWLASAFAHNLIMVNPYAMTAIDSLREADELSIDYISTLSDTSSWNSGYSDNYSFSYSDFEPRGHRIGQAGITHGYEETEATNPCYRKYLVNNVKIDHLQIELDYDHEQDNYPESLRSDEINLKRNFYTIDIAGEDPCFII
jgi:hypothetical protein